MASMKFSTSWWSVILVFLLSSSGFHLEFADAFTDTISQGQSITTSQTIISAGGEFELGFFSPGNSTKYHVGIWYKKVSEPTIVWVANRDYSFTDPSVVLTVRTDGNLEHIIKQAKLVPPLLDSEIFTTLREAADFYLARVHNVLASGTGAGWAVFDLIREMRSNDVFNFSYSFSKEESYINYSIYNSSIIGRFVLDVSGQIKQMSWLEASHQWHMFWFQPKTQCEVYAYCGPFGICHDHAVDRFCECLPGFEPGFPNNWNLNDTSGGCVRKADLQCGNSTHANGERDQFHRVSNVRLPDYPLTLPTSVSSSKWKVWLIVTLAISVTSAFVIWGIRRRLRRKGENLLLFDLSNSSVDTNYELSEANKLWRGEKKEVDLPMFSFVSVSAATNNFSIENKLGEGGFGPVYKGKSQKGYEVAVKRLSKRSGQGWEELKNEAMLIAKLQHKNLVKLFGCCIEQDEKILIYEYMPNKSLDFFLFDPTKHGILNWKTRVHIIKGVAQGLLYLHQYSRLRIIHRDFASNILLDKDMNPKISDFGMARIFGGNESKATNHIVGTYGYMSPEYALEGLFSTKSDVFSFGVLLLEILSGKKNTGFYQTDSLNLLGYAWDLWKDSRGQELMDPGLEETLPTHILLRYINVGLLCVQESADDRPTMSDVVSMLGNESKWVEPHISQNRAEVCSLNGVTLSVMEAR
ncbi:hypothetical protein AAG906_011676 [Vitis piasezkii]